MRAAKFTSLFVTVFISQAAMAWNVDFSRRQNSDSSNSPMARELNMPAAGMTADRAPASAPVPVESKTFMDKVIDGVVPTQDLVILNTEQGFVPSTLRVKEGSQYRIVVVNVNEKARNVSFVLDAFSEHHATFYGKIKTFTISPKKEGVYSYVSPETSAQGRLVVYPSAAMAPSAGPAVPTSSARVRAPASAE
jgi:plastocyanin